MAASTAHAGGAAGCLPRVGEASAPEGLSEFRLYRPRADHPEWRRLQSEADEIERRVRPRLEPPRRGWRERRRRWHAYATTAAQLRREPPASPRRARGPAAALLHLDAAPHLQLPLRVLRRPPRAALPGPAERGGSLHAGGGIELLRIMRTGTPSVYFSGGEPTLRKDLPLLTRAARDLDYYPIIVNTNGSVIDRLLERARLAHLARRHRHRHRQPRRAPPADARAHVGHSASGARRAQPAAPAAPGGADALQAHGQHGHPARPDRATPATSSTSPTISASGSARCR